MSKFKLIIYLLAPIFFGAFNSIAQETELKVITFNIRSIEPNFNITPHVDYILKEKPDLVAYQEVEVRTSRMNNRDLILEIASKTGMFTYFSPAYKKSDGVYGNAILSKFPIVNSFYIPLPKMQDQGGSDPRVALLADILVSNGKTIRFINVHLDHTLPDDGRKYKQLEPVLSDLKNRKIILAGDLNAWFGGDTLIKLITKFDRQTNNNYTHQGGSKLDYILTYPKDAWQGVSTKVDYGNHLSDHYPVISVLKF